MMDVELEFDDQPSSYTCHYCNQSFTLKCNLVSHIRAHIGDKPHSCDVCYESFSTKSGLALHFRTHKDIGITYKSTSPGNYKFICHYCDKGFSLKSNLILHIRTHTGEKPYRCTYCNKTSATKYNLLSHIRTHYSQKTIKCGYCDKYFSSRKNLHSHVQIHISTKRYYCSYCDKSSIHKGTLRVHERIHTGERPYKCIYCSKSFNHRSNLTHHVRIHTGERPFVCKYCNKAFRQKYALDGHERIHTGDRPYVCTDCNKSFPYSASLRSHMKMHDGEQVFTCYYCMRSFNSKVSLSLHIRIHVGNNNPPKKYVNKNDEILLQKALESQSAARIRKNHLKADPLIESNVDVKTEKIDYDNPQVDSVVNVLLTPELESGLVQDLNDTSSTDELKNRLREQLCKFINKYSLKNLPANKVSLKNVPVVSPKPKPSTEYYDVKPTLPITKRAAVQVRNNNPPKKYVNKNDEILLQKALESQSAARIRKNHLKADPLIESNVDVKTEKIDYDNPQVDSVVNVLLTPELESGLVQDLNDTSSTDNLKNRLREQLCKFVNKYSLKNLPANKVSLKNVPVVSPKPKPSTEYYDVKPALPITKRAAVQENSSQASNSVRVVSPNDSSDLNLRANAIEEIEKLGLKARISAQLKTIVNSGMMKKERKQDQNTYRSVVVQLPPPKDNNLKSQMNNRLQKLFQSNLVKRFDSFTTPKVEAKETPEVVEVKLEAEAVQDDRHRVDENSQDLVSDLAADWECADDISDTEELSGEKTITEPITEVHIKVEKEETEEGMVVC